MKYLREHKDGVILQIHAQPRASRNALAGVYGDALKIAIQAPPVDSAANEAIREFLAELFHQARSTVILKSGDTSRKKSFQILGLTIDKATAILKEHLK